MMQAKYLIFFLALSLFISGCVAQNIETPPVRNSDQFPEDCGAIEQVGFAAVSSVSPVGTNFNVAQDGSVSVLLRNNFGKDVTVQSIAGDTGTSEFSQAIFVPEGQTAWIDSSQGSVANIVGVRTSSFYYETITLVYNSTPGINIKSSGILRTMIAPRTSDAAKAYTPAWKVACSYANIVADPVFAKYDNNTGMFSVQVENTGTLDSILSSLVVEYPDSRVSKKMQLKDADVLFLKSGERKMFGPINLFTYISDTSKSGISASLTDVPTEITISVRECENVKTTVYLPIV